MRREACSFAFAALALIGLGAGLVRASERRLALPADVPYLGPKQRYVVGNGIGFAVGDGSGSWSVLNGPGYTGSNLIEHENLSVEIDGTDHPVALDLHRLRKTGVYSGAQKIGDLIVRLVDFAPWGAPRLSRLVWIENTSATPHEVRIRARVQPLVGPGRTQTLIGDASAPGGLVLEADTTVEAAGWMGNNVADRVVMVAWTDGSGTAAADKTDYLIQTGVQHLPPHGEFHSALVHRFHYGDDEPDAGILADIRHSDPVADLKRTISQWSAWFDDVPPSFRLEKITDPRARDLVEGGLAVIKTNQSQDGGFMSNSTCYIECYPRDDALGLRGLAATGHFVEMKKWLIWLDSKWYLWGHLADSYSGEPSLRDGTLHLDLGDCNVEETAYYLLCARDYYRATGDLATLDRIRPTLAESMDVQLKDAMAQGEKLDFEGDETEGCSANGAVPTDGTALKEWGDNKTHFWSMPSVAMCAAALDFYIRYLELHGQDPATYRNSLTKTTIDLPAELKKLLVAMDRDFWRTDLPDFPDGFHDWGKRKSDGAWPAARVVNFTLMPVYFGTPYDKSRRVADVRAMASYFDPKTGVLPLFPPIDNGFDGHDLGYLLWDLIAIGDPRKDEVYHALVDGPTCDAWGSFNEGYNAQGQRNDHDLRTLETGVNISAIAKYWNLGR